MRGMLMKILVWQFDGDFILWDMKRDAFVEPILHALIPAKKGN
jgi:hypothetical protein